MFRRKKEADEELMLFLAEKKALKAKIAQLEREAYYWQTRYVEFAGRYGVYEEIQQAYNEARQFEGRSL